MTAPLYPLCFRPVYQSYPWGGDRIIRRFGRSEPPGIYAESWEISDRPEGLSVVENGPLTGRSLADLLAHYGAGLIGSGRGTDRFPLLIKVIDARERLSVQVHPDDATAARFGGEAKTEMWYLLDAEPGAQVYAGLRIGVDEEQLREALTDQRLEKILAPVPVAAGDAVFMPGGRVHAIDAGCLVLEVQQNSNTTYRLFDWGRTDARGRPRALHVEEALRVIRWDDPASAKVCPRRLGFMGGNELWEVLACPYFRVERLVVKEDWPCALDGRTFHALFVAGGAVNLGGPGEALRLAAGTSCLVPAAVPEYALEPDGTAAAEVIRITTP
jgi:mannose-6-phosphate isomerase